MSLPVFFSESIGDPASEQRLGDESARHILSVLRMRNGDRLRLTDGRGRLADAVIASSDKKKCIVRLDNVEQQPKKNYSLTLAISLLKNSNRFEWLLEKATEIGVTAIVPLICDRTEKQHFRADRMKNILISAMLQSQQVWLPDLPEPVHFDTFLTTSDSRHKFIAHCLPGYKQTFSYFPLHQREATILIGPEGDFTPEEVQKALQNGCIPLSLGNTRLRTETAGLVGVTLMVWKLTN